ncbi:MAG: hypothetical protein WAM82_05835 [Thermoanaerobaculia bacterium]
MGQSSRQRRYSREEVARRGDEIYEIDRDEIAASDRLLARHPNAQVWLRQVGSPYARRFGPRFKTSGLPA